MTSPTSHLPQTASCATTSSSTFRGLRVRSVALPQRLRMTLKQLTPHRRVLVTCSGLQIGLRWAPPKAPSAATQDAERLQRSLMAPRTTERTADHFPGATEMLISPRTTER